MLSFIGIAYQVLPSNIKEFSFQFDRWRPNDRRRTPGGSRPQTCVWPSKAAQTLIRLSQCVAMS